nr:hypothetical protein [Pandoravirus massiliensis]
MTSRLFGCVDVVKRAAAWALHPKHARALIMSRAPCYMIAQALPLYVSHASSETNPESLIEVAARGGRAEVMCLVHQYITVRITPFFSLSLSFPTCARSFALRRRLTTALVPRCARFY